MYGKKVFFRVGSLLKCSLMFRGCVVVVVGSGGAISAGDGDGAASSGGS